MRNFGFAFLAFLPFITTAAWGGTKEEVIRLQSDVLQLQTQVRLLQKAIHESGGIVKSLLEQLNDQVATRNVIFQRLESALRGQESSAADSSEQIRQAVQNLSVKLDDTNNRIASLHHKVEEQQLHISTLRTTPSAAGGTVEPDQVYSAAYNDYLMGNYDLAVAGFQDFLASYPDSEYGGNAAYYMGDAYSIQHRYELAIQAFDQVINLYPKGDKTPNSYYKKALALQQIQKHSEAVEIFKSLMALSPDSHESNLAARELERLGVNLSPTRR